MTNTKRKVVKKKAAKAPVPLTDIEFAELHAYLERTLSGKSLTSDEAIFLIGVLTFATDPGQRAMTAMRTSA